MAEVAPLPTVAVNLDVPPAQVAGALTEATTGRAFTVMVPAFASLVQPFELVTVTVKAVLALNDWEVFVFTEVVLVVPPIFQL